SGGRGNVGTQPLSRCIFAGHLPWWLSPARMDRYHVHDHCFQRAAVFDPGDYWRVSPSDLSRGNTTAGISGERSHRRYHTGWSMTDGVVKIHVSHVDGVESLAWSENLSVQLPAVVANALGNGRDFSTAITITPAAIERARAMRSKAMHASLRLRAAFTDRPPPSSRLPISYHILPAWLRAFTGSAIGRMKRRQVAQWANFPGWPIDLSTDFLADLFFATEHSPFAGKA